MNQLSNVLPSLPAEREGTFKQGIDGRGNPYETKVDTDGVTTKVEVLGKGTGDTKVTVRVPNS